jgi:hypothetical protein
MKPLNDDEQELIAAILRSAPPAGVPADFLARVNARIDKTSGWLGLADFRVWTLRLAPAAAALALVAALWSVPSTPASAPVTSDTSAAMTAAARFSPASSSDWQTDVSGDALLEAALAPRGESDAR